MWYQRNQIEHSTVKMTILLKNKILEKVQENEGITDKELLKMLTKDEVILENEFNKTLLDLEIKGLISVSWLTKDTKRIEITTIENDNDDYEKQIQETEDKDYEASFPNSD